MTIFRLYAENGFHTGFWIQHPTWPNACAQVLTIAGRRHGSLPGAAPLHDNAEVIVAGFDVRSGRPLPLTPKLERPEDKKYTLIAKPSWYDPRKERAKTPPLAAAGGNVNV